MSYSQSENIDYIVGKNQVIASKFLDEDRGIQIYLPKDYLDSKKKYPVLYVMDSQEYFLQAVAHQDMLRFQDYSPEFIVVGIKTHRQKRRQLLYEDEAKFTSFLQHELVTYIDTNFRTLKEDFRIYFGWEMSGGFGLELLGKQQPIFSDFIIASPTHISEKRIASIQGKLTSQSFNLNSVYIARAAEESFIADEFKAISDLFKGLKDLNAQVTFKVFENETHHTTPTKTIHNSLLNIFNDYAPIRFFSLQEYDDFGGVPALRTYYKNRGERYFLDTNISETSAHFLIFFAMREDKFERFDNYVNTFPNFINNQIVRDFWYNRFAQYYVKNNKFDKALNLYKIGLKKFPESLLLNHETGNTYKLQNNLKNARIHFEKAIELAKKNDDSELTKYEESLKNLKTKS
jgi:predicted alpha/beta superfamily hydrolase